MAEHEDFAATQYLYLTTMGRKSGLPREIEIWFVHHAGRFYLLAEHFHRTQWVKNIAANPRVSVRVADRRFTAAARVLDEARDAALYQMAQQLGREKYDWGDGLPVEITPDEFEPVTPNG
ncbi:MAG TPA: nitroreductase family deazaflavin-dependent oxidoreductase [Blastocatellia bacterium]|nr:nitroreductase family deazaflavin-dependent oxidoreductase [Blastocatellia bacterium]